MNVLYRYNKTVWSFRDTGSIHYPSPMFISLGCASGNKPRLNEMETAYITHNHTLYTITLTKGSQGKTKSGNSWGNENPVINAFDLADFSHNKLPLL